MRAVFVLAAVLTACPSPPLAVPSPSPSPLLRSGDPTGARCDVIALADAPVGVSTLDTPDVETPECTPVRFSRPHAVAAGRDGSLYVADTGGNRIRHVAIDGTVRTIAGGRRGAVDGPGAIAAFAFPTDLDVAEDGTIAVADSGNDAVRLIAPDRVVITLADGFASPTGVAFGPEGDVYVADNSGHVIRRVTRDGQVTVLAGTVRGPGQRDGDAETARFRNPSRLRYDPGRDALVVADTGNHAVRLVTLSGEVTTLFDDPALLDKPTGLALDGDRVVLADEGAHVLVEVHADGRMTVLAGSAAGSADGSTTAARFAAPKGVAVLGPGLIAVADRDNGAVRLVRR